MPFYGALFGRDVLTATGQAMLGLWSFAPLKTLIVDPALPEWLPDLTIKGPCIADARVSLRFFRQEDGASDYEVLSNEGGLNVLRQSPPEAVGVGPLERIGDLVGSWLTH